MTTKTKNLITAVSIFAVTTLYYLFRPVDLLGIFLVAGFSFMTLFFFPKLINITVSTKVKNIMLLAGISMFLVFSYFNTRLYSFDGILNHWRMVLLVAQKGYVAVPEKPYLGEFLLGYVLRWFNLRFVNLVLGVWSVFAVYLTYKLVTVLVEKPKIQKTALALTVLSQPFLALAFTEFKMDMLLYTLVTCCLIIFLKITRSNEFRFLPLMMGMLSLAVLVKSSVIPTVLVMTVLAFWQGLLAWSKNWKHLFLGALCFFAPLVFWGLTFGMTIPHFDLPVGDLHTTIVLEKDEHLLAQCVDDKLKSDYQSFIYGARTPLVLLQPIFFISSYSNADYAEQPLQSLGIFLYVGIFLFVLFGKKFKNMFWIVLGTLIPFYFFTAVQYWYLLYLYPFFAIGFLEFIEKVDNTKLRKLFHVLVFASLVSNIFRVGLLTVGAFSPIKNFSGQSLSDTFLKDTYEYNKTLEKFAESGKILDASEKGHQVFTLFMKDNDTKVVRSYYYFATSGKTDKEMKSEFMEKGIRYITVNADALEHEWYVGCPKENNLILKEFLEKHTTRVTPSVFEITF